MCKLQTQLIIIYYKSLDDFYTKIPEEYKHKKNIQNFCKYIKKDLTYCAPEIISEKFNKLITRISNKLPRPATDWSIEGWNILYNASEQSQKILIKEYN